MQERLQKFLARSGVASRRKAEDLIASGRVTVNAKTVTELGTKVDPARDLVEVDGKLVSAREEHRYYLLYKPPGCVTTLSDPQGRPTAAAYLEGVKERVFPVGRLDYDAEGAVLFTTDGELANRLAHPRYGHERVYLAKVKGEPRPEQLERMTSGVRLEDGPARALLAELHERAERNTWIRIVVGEGRYHLVKRLCEAVGLQVVRLFRPEHGGASVAGLRPGSYRPLTQREVRALRVAAGLERGAPAAPAKEARARELPKAARRHGHGAPRTAAGQPPYARAPYSTTPARQPSWSRAPAPGGVETPPGNQAKRGQGSPPGQASSARADRYRDQRSTPRGQARSVPGTARPATPTARRPRSPGRTRTH